MKKPPGVDNDKRLLVIPLIIIAAVVFLDQLTKYLVVQSLVEGQTVSVLGSFFQLKLVYNLGGALGTSFGSSDFYLGTSIIILIVILYMIYYNRLHAMIAWPLAACAGGAIGNMIDRIWHGQVVDFLDFDFIDFSLFGTRIERWWTFNVADAAITVGIIFLIIYILFSPRPSKQESLEERKYSRPASDTE